MTSAFTETFTTLNESFAKMIDRNRSLVERTLRTTQEESLRFINRRLERNAKTLENLRDSQGLKGLITAEQDWLVCAARDYVEGTEKFGEIMLELAANGARDAATEGRSAVEAFRAVGHESVSRARRGAEGSQRQAAE